MKWGEERSTDDLEGVVTTRSANRPSLESIESILARFKGEIQQVPPAFSAIKVEGERAYDLARSGAEVVLASRAVRIDDLRLIAVCEQDSATFEVTCGKGTYIRSLARDMGRALGCLGHVTMLRRIAVGALQRGPHDFAGKA